MKLTFGVIGGDRRQAYLAELLRQDGFSVRTYGLSQWNAPGASALDDAADADAVVLPVPLCRDAGILNCAGVQMATADLFPRLKKPRLVTAGKINPAQYREASAADVDLTDYLLREEAAVANAVFTAEGAVQIAMEQLPGTLCGSTCLVIGFGRIGKLLARCLAGLGAQVFVSARKYADWAWIRALGWQPLKTDQLQGRLGEFQAVFNTVPAKVLDSSLLAELPEGCLCMELASVPGFDMNEAENRGLRAVQALGLPGKTSPRAAAETIRNAVYHILEERGDFQ
jgi:dipicolinate synthase subunit A